MLFGTFLIMTHCQIRPILTFIFSKLHFFSEVKKGSLKWSFPDFIIFPKRFCPIESKNSTFQSHKNTHFSWIIAQILHKNQIPILVLYFICKVCTIVLENWDFLWHWKGGASIFGDWWSGCFFVGDLYLKKLVIWWSWEIVVMVI